MRGGDGRLHAVDIEDGEVTASVGAWLVEAGYALESLPLTLTARVH